MSERMAKKKRWDKCSAADIAWLGINVEMTNFTELADWLDALVRSCGCGFGPGDAFGGSSNSLATWMSILADKIRETSKRGEKKRKGKWLNGRNYEYEFAVCSECGRMQWAGWDSHAEAKEKIGDFYKEYAYCPGCGVKMEGGRYVD